jgi:hypothetical protein
MSVAFAQSLRSLQAERRLFSLFWLLLVSALLLIWLLWFFLASIAIQVHGQIVQTTRDGVVIAEFPATAQARLQRGQVALIHPQDRADQTATGTVTIPATITEIRPAPQNARLRVTLYADMDSPDAGSIYPGLSGRVDVIVAHSSPATLVLSNGSKE